MDALTEQFLIESRELISQAVEDLVALERDPADASRIERLFRAFHTLKGSAGIVELPPMVRLMHAAEEVLGFWREGRARPSTDLIDWALGSLDQTEDWLEHFQASGDLPADADERAALLIARQGNPSEPSGIVSRSETPAWVREMLARLEQGADGPLVALEYEPRLRCFFDGDDPLDLLRRLPGLLNLHVGTRDAWPSLETADPFACTLRLRAIAKGSAEDVRALFRFVADQVWIGLADVPPPAAPGDSLLTTILAEQVRLIETASDEDGVEGRLDSAARTAAGVLRHAGARDRARRVEAAGQEALATGNQAPLLDALRDLPSRSETPEMAGVPGMVLRVDPARMDALSDLVGEVVVARNALAYLIREGESGLPAADLLRALRERGDEIDRLANHLQQSVMELRLLPLAPVFRRFPRLVRETSRTLGKKVALVTSGEEEQVDKAIVDMLFEPLLHLVRNALDHGIEAPDERLAQGKPDEGVITLTACPRGERIVIEIADDGRGLDEDAIRRTAVARGLLSVEEALRLSSAETLRLVFRPGFSTATQVSNLSGRGVGMDAVRAAVEAVGGGVELSSQPGQGTTCRLDLPIGMSLKRILVVRVGAERFGLPMDRAAEVLRLPRRSIQVVHGGQAFVLRGRTVPMMDLADLLGVTGDDAGQEVLTVVVSSGQGLIGVAVDAIEERLDVALRPSEGLLAAVPNLLGTTLRGDGRVLLVLDLEALLR